MLCVLLYSHALRVPYLSILLDDYSSLPLDCRLEPGDTTLEIVQDTAVVYIEDNDSEFIVKYLGLHTNSCPCDFFPNA